MKTLQYLNDKVGCEDALLALTEELAIKVSINNSYPNLYVLNYNQINSPKSDEIVKECRSLVICSNDNGTFSVVSRSFDRFLNYGESFCTPDIATLFAHEKVDGSLVSIFNYRDRWLYRTRSVIMPINNVNDTTLSWNDFIEEAIFWDDSTKTLDKNYTYILEVTSPENRIVTKYEGRSCKLLAVRDNTSGNYKNTVGYSLWETTASYKFNSLLDCMAAAKQLPLLQEGYVMYDKEGVPICKVKNPAYVAAHHLRGEGLNPKNIMQLVVMNEQEEYLTVFPEDKEKFKPYIDSWEYLETQCEEAMITSNTIPDQKEFAIKVKDLCFNSILFQARSKKQNVLKVLHSQKESYKLKLLETISRGVTL